MTGRFAFAIGAVALLLSACQNKEATVTGADGNAVTLSVDASDAAGMAGGARSTSNGTTWPASIAGVAPEYPGASIESTSVGGVLGANGATVRFTTADSPAKVGDFYKAAAKKAGNDRRRGPADRQLADD